MNEHKKHGHDMQDELKEHFDGAMSTLKEIKDPGKFDFKKEFMNAIEILKLNEKKMTEIATRKTTATAAFLFALLGIMNGIVSDENDFKGERDARIYGREDFHRLRRAFFDEKI